MSKFSKRLGMLDEGKKLKLDSIMNYRPFKGWTLESVINHNPGFIRFLIDRGLVELENMAYEWYIYQLESQNDRQYRED